MISNTIPTRISVDKTYLTSMKEFYEDNIRNYPDMIDTADIICITGFSKSAITNWVRAGRLKAILYKRKFLFPKEYILEFLTGSYYLSIIRKTVLQQHTLALFHALYMADLKEKGCQDVAF